MSWNHRARLSEYNQPWAACLMCNTPHIDHWPAFSCLYSWLPKQIDRSLHTVAMDLIQEEEKKNFRRMVKLDCELVSASGNYWDNLQENTLIVAIFKPTAGKKSANTYFRKKRCQKGSFECELNLWYPAVKLTRLKQLKHQWNHSWGKVSYQN